MVRERWERFGALGGFVFTALILIGALLPGSPPTLEDPASKVFRYYEDNAKQIKAASFLVALATLFLLWWLSSLWSAMRRTRGGDRLGLVAAGGAVVGIVLFIASAAMNAAIAVDVGDLGPRLTAAFYTLETFLVAGTSFGFAALVGATSAVAMRSSLLPRALAWGGALLAAALVVAGLGVAYTRDAIFYLGVGVFLVWLVWLLAVSVVLYRAPDTAA